MKIDILTLFPDMFEGFKGESIIKRAIDDNKVIINTINFRNFTKNKHKKVDDTPYGGGSGMVLMCQPVFDAVKSIKEENSKVILMSPQGRKFNQQIAKELSKEKHLIFICGHYEGFDERIKTIVDDEISIGDYVLTGGELPSMVISDSIIRLLPNVIKKESYETESFYDNLLDYPTYTKPRDYKGLKVPDVLLSGDHKKINEWRYEKRVESTLKSRPDLLKKKYKIIKDKNKRYELIDDIKDIKVIEIKSIKKTGKYVLTNYEKTIVLKNEIFKNLSGYKLKNKNTNTKLLVINNMFIKNVIIKNIDKKIKELTYRLNLAANDSDDESSNIVLGEAQMLKQMIISMYSFYLGKDALEKIIFKIDILVKEFIRAKTYNENLIDNNISRRGFR